MKKPTMIDVWGQFTKQEKKAMVMAFSTTYPELKKDASFGTLALCKVETVARAVGGTDAQDALGLKDEIEAKHLYIKLKQVSGGENA
jgi:hypothetical protein